MADNPQVGRNGDAEDEGFSGRKFTPPPPPIGSRSARHRPPEDAEPDQGTLPTASGIPLTPVSATSIAASAAEPEVVLGDTGGEATVESGRQAPPPPPASEVFPSGGDVAQITGENGGEVAVKKRKWPKRLAIGLVVAISVLVIAVGAFFLWAYNRVSIPEPTEFALAQTTVVYYNDGETELGRFSR